MGGEYKPLATLMMAGGLFFICIDIEHINRLHNCKLFTVSNSPDIPPSALDLHKNDAIIKY